MNRRSDIIFFGTLIIAMIAVMIFVLFDIGFPIWLTFWWIILIPAAFSKVAFPNSKFTKWLNGEAFKK